MRQNYNFLSRWYAWIARSEASLVQLGLEMLAPCEGETILEIGPGTGQSLVTLVQKTGQHPFLVCGLDLSDRMLAAAARRLEQAGMRQKVLLSEGDGCYLPFSNQHFDAIFMSFTLELFSQTGIQQVLSECGRVLCPGGRLCVVSLLEPERPMAMVKLYTWLNHQYPTVIDCRPIPLREVVALANFDISAERQRSIWGLPISSVLATRSNNRAV
jgi:ubiquinone/menaquinone biosynthesis C-methylase UbiE